MPETKMAGKVLTSTCRLLLLNGPKAKKSMNIRGKFAFKDSPIKRQNINPLKATVNVMLIRSF